MSTSSGAKFVKPACCTIPTLANFRPHRFGEYCSVRGEGGDQKKTEKIGVPGIAGTSTRHAGIGLATCCIAILAPNSNIHAMSPAAMPYRILAKCALTALLATFCVSGAQAQNAANGRRIAERWCSSCHIVDPNDNRPVRDTVPSFMAIANTSTTTKMALAAFLTTPHYPMPNFVLSRGEIADVSAYIMSPRKSP